jgi:ATP-dependent Clp protease ATP-binding subunit ClpC
MGNPLTAVSPPMLSQSIACQGFLRNRVEKHAIGVKTVPRFGSVFNPQYQIGITGTSDFKHQWSDAAVAVMNRASQDAVKDIAELAEPGKEDHAFEYFKELLVEKFLNYAQADEEFLQELRTAGIKGPQIERLTQTNDALPELLEPTLKSWLDSDSPDFNLIPDPLKKDIFKAEENYKATVTTYTQMAGYENYAYLPDLLRGFLLSPVFGDTAIKVLGTKLGMETLEEFGQFRDKFFKVGPKSVPIKVQMGEGENNTSTPFRPEESEKELPIISDPRIAQFNMFVRDMTAYAKANRYPQIIGREKELRDLSRILKCADSGNALLVGEPRIGKTSLVQGLAQKIVREEVADELKKYKIVQLQPDRLIAAAGPFQANLVPLLSGFLEYIKSQKDMILFIDEAQALLGGNQNDAVVVATLRSFLEETKGRAILATNSKEYKQYFEADGSTVGRCEPIFVDPPSVEETVEILKGKRKKFEKAHKVTYSDEMLKGIAEWSHRYIRDVALPLSAIKVMDKAGVIAQERTPGKGVEVIKNDVAEEIHRRTDIPVGIIAETEREKLLRLESTLHERVIGQDEAINAVSDVVINSRTGTRMHKGPLGKFIFLGPTGVGKTELAKALQAYLSGRDEEPIRIDMTEYMEKYSVSRLIGAPPGYIGYNEGGQLTEAIRKRPYSVVLLDEIEKAHPEVINALLPLLDEGRLTDGKGRTIDATNCIFIMTSNAGSKQVHGALTGREIGLRASETKTTQQKEQITNKGYKEALESFLSPELLNRVDDAIIFKYLTPDEQKQVIELHLSAYRKFIQKEINLRLDVEDSAIEFLKSQLFVPQSAVFDRQGGRKATAVLQKEIETPLGRFRLKEPMPQGGTVKVSLAADGKRLAFTKVDETPLDVVA